MGDFFLVRFISIAGKANRLLPIVFYVLALFLCFKLFSSSSVFFCETTLGTTEPTTFLTGEDYKHIEEVVKTDLEFFRRCSFSEKLRILDATINECKDAGKGAVDCALKYEHYKEGLNFCNSVEQMHDYLNKVREDLIREVAQRWVGNKYFTWINLGFWLGLSTIVVFLVLDYWFSK